MKILILGAGRVGSSLASTLSKQQYEVSVIDLSKDKLQRLQEDFDLAVEVGHGSYPSTLKKAGADEETILLAVTNSDECNITSCQIAKSKFNVKKTICRLSNASYLDSLDAFGDNNIDIAISPENEVTEHLVDLIKHPGAEQIESFANGSIKVVSVKAKKDGININAICPGAIKTDMLTNFAVSTKNYQSILDEYSNNSLLGRVGDPEDIASVALFLASSLSNYMTGEILTVDGGYSLKNH